MYTQCTMYTTLSPGIVEYLEVSQCIGSCVKNLRYMVDTNVICKYTLSGHLSQI